ncbi:zinc ribbon domain-containing protein [Murimonas intestini]|uniref:Recombinase-like zinc beta ribbon protein n=1 Tax=Murimonas intestini TaxID=1337051 RepID=A0AB73T577_9FIRM
MFCFFSADAALTGSKAWYGRAMASACFISGLKPGASDGREVRKKQEEKARRSAIYRPAAKKKAEPVKGKYSSKYVLSDILICAECGQPYRRQVWSKYGQKWAVWRCDNRLKYGSKRCKHSSTIKEDTLHQAIMAAINSVVEDQGEFVQAFRENVIRIIGSYSPKSEPTEYDEQIEQLQQRMMALIEDSAKAECADEMFDKEYRVIANEIKELKKKKAKLIRERQLAESYDQRMQDMESYMKKASYLKREFDDDLVRRLLQTVRVINESKIEIQFKSGIVMTQRIDFED